MNPTTTPAYPPSVARYLRAPRMPKTAPVVIIHLIAPSVDGNAREAYVVLSPTGRTVELLREGSYTAESQVWARWPWFSHTAARGLGIVPAYGVTMWVSASELKRWLRQAEDLDTTSPDVVQLRADGTRYAKWSAVREALTSIRRSAAEHAHREHVAELRDETNHYGDTSSSVIYHRHPQDGGDDVSDHLRRAMAALVRAGMVERTDGQETSDRAFFRRSVASYRATTSTPDLY